MFTVIGYGPHPDPERDIPIVYRAVVDPERAVLDDPAMGVLAEVSHDILAARLLTATERGDTYDVTPVGPRFKVDVKTPEGCLAGLLLLLDRPRVDGDAPTLLDDTVETDEVDGIVR